MITRENIELPNQSEIHRKILSNEVNERRMGIAELYINFLSLPDKKKACEDVCRLVEDMNRDVRMFVARSLGIAFPHFYNKKQAWDNLIRLAMDKDYNVQFWASDSIRSAFPNILDKKQAWEDLIILTKEESHNMLRYGIKSLKNVFPYAPDKNQAWKDLVSLTNSNNILLLHDAIYALGTVFPFVTDRKQAWKDLHQLTLDERSDAQWDTADVLGMVFSYIPDKKQALKDLQRLASDEISGLRIAANYSLGRAFIFNATEAGSEEDFRNELELALKFFEQSVNEAVIYEFFSNNPAKFCLPFYRSLYTILFKKQDAEAEVQNYFAEAKSVTEGKESKEQLLEVVKNLESALKEVTKIRKKGFGTMKYDLNVYRQYCERAAELMKSTKEKAPDATKNVGERIAHFRPDDKKDHIRDSRESEYCLPTIKRHIYRRNCMRCK